MKRRSFSRSQLDSLLAYATKGIEKLIQIQKEVLGPIADQIEQGTAETVQTKEETAQNEGEADAESTLGHNQ